MNKRLFNEITSEQQQLSSCKNMKMAAYVNEVDLDDKQLGILFAWNTQERTIKFQIMGISRHSQQHIKF